MIPKYTGVWDRGSMWRGDTLLGFARRIFDEDTGIAVIPTEVCAHIVDSFGRKVVAQVIRSHVQACFDREADLLEALESGTYEPEMLETGWPNSEDF